MSRPVFNIGITMAGAVSAGAYTAGFMDYLLEVLHKWEDQKKSIRKKLENGESLTEYEKKIPLHDVSIEALGGASAGGMVSMITALSVYERMEPVREPTLQRTGNMLYDSWVLLDDDLQENRSTFERMLETDDLENEESRLPSLLNSRPIDRIADKVYDNLTPPQNGYRPEFISKDLRVLLTLCSLKGVSFELNFDNFTSSHFLFTPGHRMSEHMIVAHFKTRYEEDRDKDIFLNLDPFQKESRELLKLCTKATGAFPFGLAPRQFKGWFSEKYIKNCILRNLEIEGSEYLDIKLKEGFFDFTCVDGGTINNEPYGEVVQVLESIRAETDPKKPMSGVIMVDPFPNFYDQDSGEAMDETLAGGPFQDTLWKVIPKLYGTLRQQVRVKHSGSFYKDFFRQLVFPFKWDGEGNAADHPPISCAALDGFGGFLDIRFRQHDFFLGRDNARNFLRAYFFLEYDPSDPHPLFEGLSEEMIDTFRKKRKKDDKKFMPIIPDLNLIEDQENGHDNPFYYTIPEFPKLDPKYFEKIRPALTKRVDKMLTSQVNLFLREKWFLRFGVKIFRGKIVKRAVNWVVDQMQTNLKKRKML